MVCVCVCVCVCAIAITSPISSLSHIYCIASRRNDFTWQNNTLVCFNKNSKVILIYLTFLWFLCVISLPTLFIFIFRHRFSLPSTFSPFQIISSHLSHTFFCFSPGGVMYVSMGVKFSDVSLTANPETINIFIPLLARPSKPEKSLHTGAGP